MSEKSILFDVLVHLLLTSLKYHLKTRRIDLLSCSLTLVCAPWHPPENPPLDFFHNIPPAITLKSCNLIRIYTYFPSGYKNRPFRGLVIRPMTKASPYRYQVIGPGWPEKISFKTYNGKVIKMLIYRMLLTAKYSALNVTFTIKFSYQCPH